MEYLIKKLGIQEKCLLLRTFSNVSLLSLSLLIKLNHVIKLFSKILNGNLTFKTILFVIYRFREVIIFLFK